MPPVVTSHLPQATILPYIGAACYVNQNHLVAVGGGGAGLFTLFTKARAFNRDGTHLDLPDRPDGQCVQGDPGTAQGVARLPNGDLVLVGVTSGNALDQQAGCRRLVASTQTWATFPTPPQNGGATDQTEYFPFTLPDGRIVMFTTVSGSFVSWIWDPGSNLWTPTTAADAWNDQYQTGCRLSDGRVLIVGSYPSLHDSFFWNWFDPSSGWKTDLTGPADTFTIGGGTTATISTPFAPALASLGGGKALLVINYFPDNATTVNKAFVFNGTAWHEVPAPTTNRQAYGIAGSWSNEAFVVGGQRFDLTYLDSIERFDGGLETWSAFDTLPAPARRVTCLTACDPGGSLLWCAGGEDSTPAPIDTVLAYAVEDCTCDVCGGTSKPHPRGHGAEHFGDPLGGGGPLQVVRARAVQGQAVRVVFNEEPRHTSAGAINDALNPANYQLILVTGEGESPLAVGVDETLFAGPAIGIPTAGDERGLDVHVDRPLALGIRYRVTVRNVVSAFGGGQGAPYFAEFMGIEAPQEPTPAPQRRVDLVDFDNPPARGAWQFDGSGDINPSGGLEGYRKRVLRRITTTKNAFRWLSGYGVGLRLKETASLAEVAAMKVDILQQVKAEPETASATVSVKLDGRGILTIQVAAKTRAGAFATFGLQVSPDGTISVP
jgi:hypothetical protein